jgi:phenylalanyl-tRNA synthetase beta chain
MRIPLSWLQEYIHVNKTSSEIAKILTLAGMEVDAIEPSKMNFKGVVAATVLDTKKHPEADKLCVATVTDGQQEFQIVCGAPNCRPGLKTALARIDATLTGDDGKTFAIKKTKLRGVESSGMLCSNQELGLGADGDGIIELSESITNGTDLAELYADEIFEISLTPNLGHCSSLVGIARELSAATEIPVKYPEITLVEDESSPIAKDVAVSVIAPEACPRYTCRLIKDVKVGPSPDWLKNRLEAAGIRSINNIVDVTNYVMLELGNPLHAFDFDKIEGHHVVVRQAQKGEQLVTLDGKNRVFQEGDLLICDKAKPIAVGGMMGGENSEVSEATRNILLEVAHFAPGPVRKTSKHLGIMTEGSRRFERGSDPNVLKLVLDRTCQLFLQVAGGKVSKGIIEVADREFPKRHLFCRLKRINKILGARLSLSEVENIFTRLGFSAKWDGNDRFVVEVPTYRNDLHEEIDLIEEVARIYGYGNITTDRSRYASSDIPHAPIFTFEREIRSRLLQAGLQEFLTCDLIGPTLLSVVKPTEQSQKSWVRVLNPTSIEQSILRTSLLPGLLNVVKFNWDHQAQNVAGFEIGRIHFKEGETYKEQSVAGIILTGLSRPHHWDQKPAEYDFYDIKGIVENLLVGLKIPEISFKTNEMHALHPGRQAAVFVGDLEIGSIGEIHPAVQRRLDVPQRIFYAEINLHDLYQKCPQTALFAEIPQFPASERDWTLTLPESTPAAQVLEAIQAKPSPLLEAVMLRDIYRSEKLGNGLKNVTFRFVYRDKNKTIEQAAVDAEHARMIASVNLQ